MSKKLKLIKLVKISRYGLSPVVILILYFAIMGALSQDIVTYDDFSDPLSGWDVFSDENGAVAYQDGWLFLNDSTNVDKTTRTCFSEYLSDFVLDVDTKLIGGTDDNWHVIFFRVGEMGNDYGFGISADGYFGIDKFVNGEPIALIGVAKSDHIKTGREVINHMRIKCIGHDLYFYVNDHLLGKVSDSSHEGGNICLGAYAFTGTFSEIAYDNFVVAKIEQKLELYVEE